MCVSRVNVCSIVQNDQELASEGVLKGNIKTPGAADLTPGALFLMR